MIFTSELLIAGLWTGAVATLIMTVFMMIGKATGMAPIDIISALGNKCVFFKPSAKQKKMLGMIRHFLAGIIFAIVYQLLVANQFYLTDFSYQTGLLFALLPWLLMMLFMMPMMGMGLLGLKKSPKILVMTLLLHLIYGASLGYLAAL